MKKTVIFILLFSFVFATAAAASTASQTGTVQTDTLPADTDMSDELTNAFLNINVWLFTAGLILFIICSAVMILYKIKKKKPRENGTEP